MSAQMRALMEKKSGREKDVVYRVSALAVDPDGSYKGGDMEKVTFYFKGSEIFMVTQQVNGDGAKEVAFDSADSLWGALVKWCRKTEQGQHQWREDKKKNQG